MNANFVKRLGAYIIDVIILGMVIGVIVNFIPIKNNNDVLSEQLNKISDSALEEGADVKSLFHQYGDISYKIEYNNFYKTIINFGGIIIYFVIFQVYNKGQTLGKKILKIKVVKENGKDVEINDILLRSLLINSLAYSMISMSLMFIIKDYTYFIVSGILSLIQFVLLIITIFMVLYRKDKRGLHDLIGKTKVIAE